MRPVRPRLLLLAATLGVAGLVGGGIWLAGRAGAHNAGRGPLARAPGESTRVVHFEAPDERGRAARVEVKPVPSPALPTGPVAELATDAAAQFVALCKVKLLAADTELDLSHREWTKLTAAVTQAQAVRLAYEAEIATAQEVSPGHFRVEIPAYAAAGDELRQRFVAELRDGLGDAVATEVLEKLGKKLEGAFAGFGVSSQTLEITGDPQVAPGDVKIERVARYWNSADGADRVTTRREVHLPLVEDPTGESWNALLAMVGKAD